MVISNSGLCVRELKNIDLSKTTQDMKKLEFCGMSSGLCHVKKLVNTLTKNVKIWLEFEKLTQIRIFPTMWTKRWGFSVICVL